LLQDVSTKVLLLTSLLLVSLPLKSKELTIAYSDPIRPYLYVDKGQVNGIDKNVLDYVLKQAGASAKYVYAPWARALKMAQDGKVDGLLSVFCSDDSEHILKSTETTYNTNISVFSLVANNYNSSHLRAEDGARVISVVQGNYFSELPQFPHLIKVQLRDVFNQGSQLLKGHVDFSVSEESWFRSQMASRNAANKVEVIEVLESTGVCLGFSQKAFSNQPEFISDVDKGIKNLKQSGELEKIFARYGMSTPTTR